MATQDAPVALDRLEVFPALDVARANCLDALGSTESDAHLVAALEADPALAIAVLQHARSASLAEAVDRVPRADLTAIVEALPITSMIADRSAGAPTPASFRQHALSVRSVCERLARDLPEIDVEELTSAALLHDVGKLALPSRDPLTEPQLVPEARVGAEREAFGIDHAEAGARLARRWHLPESFASCIERHHEATEGPAGAIRLADMLAHFTNDREVDVEVLTRVATALGLDAGALSSLMYDVAPPLPTARTAPAAPPLSERELEILRLLARGLLAKQVAQALGLADSTVRNHLYRIYPRIGAVDRTQAILIASREGWL